MLTMETAGHRPVTAATTDTTVLLLLSSAGFLMEAPSERENWWKGMKALVAGMCRVLTVECSSPELSAVLGTFISVN